MNQVNIANQAYSGPGVSAGGTVIKNVINFSLDLNLGNVQVVTEDNQVFNFMLPSEIGITINGGVLGSMIVTLRGNN